MTRLWEANLTVLQIPTSWFCARRFGQPSKPQQCWPTFRWTSRQVSQFDSLQTGSEDLPDAYRHCPMSQDEARACLVVWHHKDWGAPGFQLYSGLLFGLPLAVTSFNRYSRFLDAAFGRLVLVLASMYFDDCNMVDWVSSKGSAQWAACQLAGMLGTPFAEEKRQAMATPVHSLAWITTSRRL